MRKLFINYSFSIHQLYIFPGELMQISVITIHVEGFKQGPSWKFHKDIERQGRKTLLRALEETEAKL